MIWVVSGDKLVILEFYMFNFLVIITLVFIGTFAYAGISAAPWFPTKKRDLKRFIDLADIKPGQKVYDLGCGDGRLVFEAAQCGAFAMGYEISLLPYILAKARLFFADREIKKRAAIYFKDFWSVDLSDADLVYVFLTPRINPKMKIKLEKELHHGARVIAYAWPLEGWNPKVVDRADNRLNLYIYEA